MPDNIPKKKKRKHFAPNETVKNAVETLRNMPNMEFATDFLGSWTGTPYDGEEPTQDADDL